MSRITYHYLLNGTKLSGNYLYDVMNMPNKALQDKVLTGYLNDRISKLKLIANEKDNPKADFAKQELDEMSAKDTVKEKMEVHFRNSYDRIGLPKLLGKPYFGVWGIHTTPADLFGVDPRYKHRLKIDCDNFDPDCIIVKVSTGKYSKMSRAMGKDYFKYTSDIYDKFCKPFQEQNHSDLVSKAFSHGPVRTVSSGVPDIIFFLPRLKFQPQDFEAYKQ